MVDHHEKKLFRLIQRSDPSAFTFAVDVRCTVMRKHRLCAKRLYPTRDVQRFPQNGNVCEEVRRRSFTPDAENEQFARIEKIFAWFRGAQS
uniref:tRNA nucleotidyltransferase n=1 Tax=Steinernema glaseri TaxID=37863 RepID=A0A1I7YVZ8_9BILA